MARARYWGLVCLLVFCINGYAEEEIEFNLRQAPDYEERVEAYERLKEMRRSLGITHLSAATQFEFARQWPLGSHTPGKTDANGCAWSSAGPTNLNGRVTNIAIDPTNNQRVYATTFGGIYRSETAGRRWQRVSDDWLATVFSAIAVNPSDTNEIIAGGGDKDLNPAYTGDGLWRSTSYGAPGTWTKVTPQFNKTVIYRIRIDPAAGNDVYVAASNGLWKGVRDAANNLTFSLICNDPVANTGCMNSVVDDVAVDFSVTPRKIYAAVRVDGPNFARGIYKWTGQWNKRDNGIDTSNTEVILLGLAASNPSVLYTRVTKVGGAYQGFYRTTSAAEGANAWTKTADSAKLDDAGLMSWFVNTVEVDPTNEKRVIASGGWPYVTTNGGDKFDWIWQGMDPDYTAEVHGDMHTAAFDPVNPNIVYVGNDGGIDKSTDMSASKWHWIDSSHGMVATMFYNITSNREFPTTLAGGSQDNGIEITFGNRTWYRPVWCDGLDVGTDAKNPVNLYASCNGGLTEFGNPLRGSVSGVKEISFVSAQPPKGPVATDVEIPGAAIASSGNACGGETIITTTDGVHWNDTGAVLASGYTVTALAIAPSSSFKTFLAAIADANLDPAKCPGGGFGLPSMVIRSDDGGASWTPTFGLPTNLTVKSLAFDPTDASRSYVLYETKYKLYMSTGGNYTSIGATLPARVTRLAVDPWDANVLYVATPVGVFRGVVTLASPPSATWAPFDEGLPDGLDVNDIWVDPKTGILTIGTYGYGAYRRDINPGTTCKARMLVVRDSVYDTGAEPSVSGIPDAEHPIHDHDDFYKPDDSDGGRTSWWASRDIRVDVPSLDLPQNQIADADHVEFELCAIDSVTCEPGGMVDSPQQADQGARVYVQVTNNGIEPVTKTRVIALWAPAAAAFEKLPDTFWTTTFPFNAPCGALAAGTSWHLVDPAAPCRMIKSVNPEMPELARFDWDVPLLAHGGAAILTVVESADDPMDKAIRAGNLLDPAEIVPASRHIALRNIYINRFKIRIPRMIPIDFPHIPYEPMDDVEVVVSKPDLAESVRVVFPAGVEVRAGAGEVRRTRIDDPDLLRQLEELRLDPSNAWELSGKDASLRLAVKERITAAFIATPASERSTSRFYVTTKTREKTLGGAMILFRPE